MFETICALATPPLKGALGIIRISGIDSLSIVSKIFSKDISEVKEKCILYGNILDRANNEIIDEVVLLVYVGPKSFTGEDSVEIICHGSPLIYEEIVSLLIKCGARYALKGEFSNRAFLNNKVDLIQAEAINDVINAATKEAKKLSMLSLKGNTSKLINPIKIKIADILSLIDVNIDYPEYYDIELVTKEKIENDLKEIVRIIEDTIKKGYKANIIKDGVNIAIVGKPNAGKSSILNAFLNEKKAIVTSIPGTTRDVVEGSVSLNGVVLNLKDTAGIRNSSDEIEIEGIEKSKKAIDEADLILYIVSSIDNEEDSELFSLIKEKKYIKVYNKSDLNVPNKIDGINISAINNDISNLKTAIYKSFNLQDEDYVNPSVNNLREIGLLEKIKSNLDEAINENNDNMPLDLISISITRAYENVLEILGETNNIDVTKEIFSRFCVGK